MMDHFLTDFFFIDIKTFDSHLLKKNLHLVRISPFSDGFCFSFSYCIFSFYFSATDALPFVWSEAVLKEIMQHTPHQ